jgi:hypothetical protein
MLTAIRLYLMASRRQVQSGRRRPPSPEYEVYPYVLRGWELLSPLGSIFVPQPDPDTRPTALTNPQREGGAAGRTRATTTSSRQDDRFGDGLGRSRDYSRFEPSNTYRRAGTETASFNIHRCASAPRVRADGSVKCSFSRSTAVAPFLKPSARFAGVRPRTGRRDTGTPIGHTRSTSHSCATGAPEPMARRSLSMEGRCEARSNVRRSSLEYARERDPRMFDTRSTGPRPRTTKRGIATPTGPTA